MKLGLTSCLTAVLALGLSLDCAGQAPDLYAAGSFRTFHLTFKQAGWWDTLVANKKSETYMKADLAVDRVIYRDVGVRARGAGSFSFPISRSLKKIPFKISMDKFVPGQKLAATGSLARNGSNRLSLQILVLEDGTEMRSLPTDQQREAFYEQNL